MIKRFPLSYLLTIGLVGGFLCTLIISSAAIWQQYKILIGVQTIYEHPLSVTNAVRDVRVYTRGAWELAEKAIYHGHEWDEEIARKTVQLEEQIEDRLSVVQKQFLGKQSEVDDIKIDFEEQKRLMHAVYELLRAGDKKKAVAFAEEHDFEANYEHLSRDVNDVVVFAQAKAKEIADNAASEVKNGLKLLFALSVCFLLLGLASVIALIRHIRSEFTSLHLFATDVQNNELHKVEVDENDKSEFAELKYAMNAMVDGIIEARQDASDAYETLAGQAAYLEEQTVELEEQAHELESQSAIIQIAEEKYRTLFEQSHDGILLVDTQTQHFVEFNKAAYENLGYTAEEFARLTIKDLEVNESPEDTALHIEIMKRQGWDDFETRHYRKDRSVQDVQVVANVVMIDGRPILQTSIKDITTKKKQEESERKNAAIRKTLLDNSAVSIFLASAERKITQANKRACEMFGYSEEEMGGASFRLIHVSDESFEAFAPEYERLSGEGITNIEYPFAHKDGSIFWGSVSGIALDPNDLSKGVIWTLLDVDEKRKAQDALKKLNTQLEQKVADGIEELREKDQLMAQQAKMAAMGEMIGNIAHQWRQPLNTLMAAKDLLVMDYFDDALTQESVKEYSTQTTQTLKYLSKTIDDFRNFFKTSKAKEPFDIIKALKTAFSITSPSLGYRNIEISFESDAQSIEVFGFEGEFQQVIINIINNAKDAIMASGVNGKITVKVTKENGLVRISIEDNGAGIPSGVIEKIFDPYFTTKFKSQGTGLGLYMAKTIIGTNMQGKISAVNGENGAIFTIELPVKTGEDAR